MDRDPMQERPLPQYQKAGSLTCCGCINTNNGIKAILFLEFVLMVIAIFPFSMEHANEEYSRFAGLSRLLCFPTTFLSLLMGIMYLCRRCTLESGKLEETHAITTYISSAFVLCFGMATIQTLNVAIYYAVYSFHHHSITTMIVVLSVSVLYGLLRIYWNVVIYQHRVDVLAVGRLDQNDKQKVCRETTVIAIILAMELLFSLLVLSVGAVIGFGDLDIFRNTLLSVACFWWFGILIMSFLLGVLTVFSHHPRIAPVFLIAFLFGTVQWCTITMVDFKPRLLGIERLGEVEELQVPEREIFGYLVPIIMYLYAAIRGYFTVKVHQYVDLLLIR